MLSKPDNWNQNFDSWVESVKDGSLVYTDCLEALLGMGVITYELPSVPESHQVYETMARGKYDAAEDYTKIIRKDTTQNISKLSFLLESTCEKVIAPEVGAFGVTFNNGIASVYIVISNEDVVVFSKDGPEFSSTAALAATETFQGWWRY